MNTKKESSECTDNTKIRTEHYTVTVKSLKVLHLYLFTITFPCLYHVCLPPMQDFAGTVIEHFSSQFNEPYDD